MVRCGDDVRGYTTVSHLSCCIDEVVNTIYIVYYCMVITSHGQLLLVNNNRHTLATSGFQAAAVYMTVSQPSFSVLACLPQKQPALQDGLHNFTSAKSVRWPSLFYCLKLMLYEPVFGSLSALKLSRDMPNLPRTVLPSSFNLPAHVRECLRQHIAIVAHSVPYAVLTTYTANTSQIWEGRVQGQHVAAQDSKGST